MRLSYANLMSTLFVLLALAGGTAVAAGQLIPKKSVGTKQLKSGAVTAAKLKKNAVTTAKIKKAAVDGSKIKDGSVTGSEIDPATTPFSRIVHSVRAGGPVSFKSEPVLYPLANSTYTQEPGRDDSYIGSVEGSFDPDCEPPRAAIALVTTDPSAEVNAMLLTITADSAGAVVDQTGGQASWRIHIAPYHGGSFQPAAPTSRTISLYMYAECSAGDGASATSAAIDVIGVK